MLVAVRLREMQHDAGQHEHASQGHQPAHRLAAHRDGQCGADERREREHRARARRTEGALRKKIEAKAEPVAGHADGRQRDCSDECRQWLCERDREHGRHHRAQHRFRQDDLPRVALRKRARQRIVETPCRRGDEHRQKAEHARPATARLIEYQGDAAENQHEHRQPHPSADRLAIEDPGEHRGEHRLQRQHERRARAARALQSPGKRHRPDNRARSRHREQARDVRP